MHRPNHSSIHSDSTLIQTTEKLRSKLTKSSITVVLLALIGAPLGYGIRMILSRTLEPEMFGLMYAVIALFALLSEYNDLGFGYSVSYLIPKFLKKNQIKKVWNTFLYDLIIESGTAFFISLLIIIFGKLLATYYFKTPVAVPMLSIGLIFFISHSITSAFKKFFIGIQRERIYSSIDVFYYLIVFTATVLLFANSSTDIISYFFYWSFSYLIVSLGVMAIFILKHRDIVSRPTWDSSLFKRMFSFAVPTLLTTTIGTILKSADIFFLTLFSGLTSVGTYNIIFPIMNIPQIFMSPIRTLLMPAVSSLAGSSEDQLILVTEKILKIVPVLSFYFCFFVFMYPEPIIQTLFGSKWINLAYIPLKISAVSYLFFLTGGFLATIVSGLGLVRKRLFLSAISTIISISIGFLLIKPLGVVGAAWGGLILFTFNFFGNYGFISSVIKIKLPLKLYSYLLAFGGVFYMISWQVDISPSGLVGLLFAGTIYTFIYIIFMSMMKDTRYEMLRGFSWAYNSFRKIKKDIV